MAYIVKLGTFAKKKNSTAQPDTSGWASFNSVLKQGSELTNPTLQLRMEESDLVNYNYAYMFGAYYYITSRTMVRNDLAEIKLEKDVLATYKTAIGNSNLYIVRSSVSSDGSIVDNYYPTTAQVDTSFELQDLDTVPLVDFDSGYYLLTVMGIGGGGTASERVYQLTASQLKVMLINLYTNINGFSLSDVVQQIQQKFGGNPQDLISSVVWVPYSFDVSSTSYPVRIGSYDTGVTAPYVKSPTVDLADVYYTIPKHPQASYRGKYLNAAPFSSYSLSLNCGGIIELDSSKLIDKTDIRVRRILDIKGGLLNIVDTGASPDSAMLAKIHGQMGIAISLRGNDNAAGVISGITSTLVNTAALIATGGTSAAAAAIASGIGAVVAAAGSSSNTASGSVSGIEQPGQLSSTFYYVINEDNTNHGRPLCQMQNPANLGGYMVAEKAPLAISCTRPELEEIQRYITTGFYYE